MLSTFCTLPLRLHEALHIKTSIKEIFVRATKRCNRLQKRKPICITTYIIPKVYDFTLRPQIHSSKKRKKVGDSYITLGVLGASVKELSRLAKTSASLFCSYYIKRKRERLAEGKNLTQINIFLQIFSAFYFFCGIQRALQKKDHKLRVNTFAT